MTRLDANLYLDNGELKPLTRVDSSPKVVYVRFTEEEWELIAGDIDFWLARGAVERPSAARYLRFCVASMHDATVGQKEAQQRTEEVELENAIKRLKDADADSTVETAFSEEEEGLQDDEQEIVVQDEEKES